MQNEADLNYLLSAMSKFPKGKAYVSSIYTGRPPTVICDGVRTQNFDFARMCHSLASEYLNYEAKTSNGMLSRGSHLIGNLNQVLQDSSYISNPLSSVPQDIEVKAPDADYLRIFTMMAKIYGSQWSYPLALRVNKLSRAGFPGMEFDLVEKLVRWNNLYANMQSFIDDASRLYDKSMTHKNFIHKWGFGFIKAEGRRFQETDKIYYENNNFVPRQREVYDWLGKKVTQNRSISFYPKDLCMFTVRDRLVWGYPIELSIFSGFYAEGNRIALKKRFPFAQHHVGRDLIRLMLSDGFNHIVAGDVSNFDQNTPQKMMEIYFNSQQYMTDAIKKIHHLYMNSVSLIKNTYLGKPGNRLIGNLNNIDSHLYGGHPSGYAYVSNFNEVNGYSVVLTCLHKSGVRIDNEETVIRILEGKHDLVRVKAKGDDHICSFKDSALAMKLREVYKTWNNPYALAEELPAKFLGSAFYEGDTPYIALDDRNYIVKFLVPERSKTHIHNMLWKLGWAKRSKEYFGPASTEMHVVLRAHLKRFFNVDIDGVDFVKMSKREEEEMKKRLAVTKNLADIMFLQDPSIIYKRDILDDISPEVLATVYLSLSGEYLTNFNKYIGKGYDLHLKR